MHLSSRSRVRFLSPALPLFALCRSCFGRFLPRFPFFPCCSPLRTLLSLFWVHRSILLLSFLFRSVFGLACACLPACFPTFRFFSFFMFTLPLSDLYMRPYFLEHASRAFPFPCFPPLPFSLFFARLTSQYSFWFFALLLFLGLRLLFPRASVRLPCAVYSVCWCLLPDAAFPPAPITPLHAAVTPKVAYTCTYRRLRSVASTSVRLSCAWLPVAVAAPHRGVSGAAAPLPELWATWFGPPPFCFHDPLF